MMPALSFTNSSLKACLRLWGTCMNIKQMYKYFWFSHLIANINNICKHVPKKHFICRATHVQMEKHVSMTQTAVFKI